MAGLRDRFGNHLRMRRSLGDRPLMTAAQAPEVPADGPPTVPDGPNPMARPDHSREVPSFDDVPRFDDPEDDRSDDVDDAPDVGTDTGPLQLRITWDSPPEPVRAGLHLTGLFVAVDVWWGTRSDAVALFANAGIEVEDASDGMLMFPAKELTKLRASVEGLEVEPVGQATTTLFELVQRPPTSGDPAVISRVTGGELMISWNHVGVRHEAPLPVEAAQAVMVCDIPVLATEEGWVTLGDRATVPPVLGRARVNPDGFIEISTNQPQTVATSPLPALFRLDATHFGLPLAYAPMIESTSGFRWAGAPPTTEDGPVTLGDQPVELSVHTQALLRKVVDTLVANHAIVLAWPSGLGRRIMALAACQANDGWPLLVVCPAGTLWAWHRNLSLFGAEDATVVTYENVTSEHWRNANTIICDEPTEVDREVLRRAAREAKNSDSHRIVTVRHWPNDLVHGNEILSVIRPGEFTIDQPLPLRYPEHPQQRAAEHQRVYMLDAPSRVDPDPERFPRSRVRMVDCAPDQRTQLNSLTGDDLRERFAKALDLIDAGSPKAISPKLTAGIALTKKRHGMGRRAALVVANTRSAMIARQALRPFPSLVATHTNDITDGTEVVICVGHRTDWDLRRFDVVVWASRPFSDGLIDRACGVAGTDESCQEVHLLHLRHPISDRLAQAAYDRVALDAVMDPHAPPENLAWILGERDMSQPGHAAPGTLSDLLIDPRLRVNLPSEQPGHF